MTLQHTELPTVYQLADTRADQHQRLYRRLMYLQIFLPVASAALAVFSKWAPPLAKAGAAISGLAVIVALVVWVARPDRSWHRNRGVAEFVKSQAWRYMMRADPYLSDHAAPAAEDALQRALADQAERWRETRELAATVRSASQVSAAMRRLRELPLQQRIHFYIDHRLKEQLDWYSRNLAHSGVTRDVSYAVMLVGQLAVVPVALFYTVHTVSVSFLGVLSSLPAAAISFLRIRRHEDLAPSYAIAAQRLKEVLRQADAVVTDKEFSFYVSHVEDLLTTEHAEWLIRRS